ncbi:hypothetical protein [Rathayibacter sp. VKM Ac-2928]|uniref:hypothetical protein n=1 Tax=Rathayibacter sp. VKM Ac-2928 TaxID=2929479 RepID=UPI001FB3A3EE|nr:hypothetical protein [Rathayibacter sp. VKM Ac-2928]MCJ1682345.1 hypothetical protein [Rathayibacter sp. VKM Ac-2928]
MKTLVHTGGFVALEDETAAAVVRYSLPLSELRRMGTVTFDDGRHPETRSQVLIVVGLGVPLSVHGICGPDDTLKRGDSRADIDAHAEQAEHPDFVATGLSLFEATNVAYDVEFDFELLRAWGNPCSDDQCSWVDAVDDGSGVAGASPR